MKKLSLVFGVTVITLLGAQAALLGKAIIALGKENKIRKNEKVKLVKKEEGEN